MTKKTFTWIFLAGALVLTATSFWMARHQLTVLTKWKKAEATLQRYEVVRNHDQDGYLYFQTRGYLRYVAGGKELNASAQSYFGSPDYGWIARQFSRYKARDQISIRYDPENPEIFEFEAGYNWLYFRVPLQFLAAAIACLLAGLLLQRLSRPPKLCVQCHRAVRSFFRYCPDCGESISMEPHRMQS